MTRNWRSVHYTTLRPSSLRWMHYRQGGRCAYCERPTVMPPKGSDHREAGVLYASRDHRVPIALGGDDHRPNVVMACIPCNGRKGAMAWAEWQAFMRENPRWWEQTTKSECGVDGHATDAPARGVYRESDAACSAVGINPNHSEITESA